MVEWSPQQDEALKSVSTWLKDRNGAQVFRLFGWAADNNALMLPAHFSGHTALEIENTGNGFAIKQWGPFSRY